MFQLRLSDVRLHNKKLSCSYFITKRRKRKVLNVKKEAKICRKTQKVQSKYNRVQKLHDKLLNAERDYTTIDKN